MSLTTLKALITSVSFLNNAILLLLGFLTFTYAVEKSWLKMKKVSIAIIKFYSNTLVHYILTSWFLLPTLHCRS